MYYSDQEKEIITLLSKIDNSNQDKLERLLSDNLEFFKSSLVLFNPNEKKAILLYQDDMVKKFNQFSEIHFCLKSLQQDGLLSKFYIAPPKGIIIGSQSLQKSLEIGNLKDDELLHIMKSKGYDAMIIDEISDEINDYWIGIAYASSGLKSLVANNFKTQEQIHHDKSMLESKKQTRFALWSFYTAMGALVMTFITTYYGSIKLDKDQYLEIKNLMQKSQETMPVEEVVVNLKEKCIREKLSCITPVMRE